MASNLPDLPNAVRSELLGFCDAELERLGNELASSHAEVWQKMELLDHAQRAADRRAFLQE